MAVRDIWVKWNEPHEGRVRHFYADVKGLITIGVGNLVDPVSTALSLPMYRLDGVRANAKEIREDWEAVKRNPHAAVLGHRFAARLTRLRMRDEDIDVMVLAKFDANQRVLEKRFLEFNTWPEPAQHALHSMAWALGPHFSQFPKMFAHLRARNWAAAAEECKISEKGNPGVAPRNDANKKLFLAAAAMVTPSKV